MVAEVVVVVADGEIIPLLLLLLLLLLLVLLLLIRIRIIMQIFIVRQQEWAQRASQNSCTHGGGFLLACEDLGECSTIHSSPALLFFKVEISSRTLIRLFWPR